MIRRGLLILPLLALCALPAAAQIRGSGCQASSTASPVVSWPAGTASGDLAVIFGSSAYNPSLPSGWTHTAADSSSYFFTGQVWDGAAFWRVLNAGDISTGSVTISIANTYDTTWCITTFVGNPGSVREVDCGTGSATPACYSDDNIGPNPITVSTSSSVASSDILMLFGSARTSGHVAGRTLTFATGTAIANADSTNSYAVMGYACNASGATDEAFTWGAAASYFNVVVLVVEGAGGSAPCPVNARQHRAGVY